jgi:hypothetical protein
MAPEADNIGSKELRAVFPPSWFQSDLTSALMDG